MGKKPNGNQWAKHGLAAKKEEKKVSKPVWVTICRMSADDFDEDTGKYTGATNLVELQQEVPSKVIRTVIVK